MILSSRQHMMVGLPVPIPVEIPAQQAVTSVVTVPVTSVVTELVNVLLLQGQRVPRMTFAITVNANIH